MKAQPRGAEGDFEEQQARHAVGSLLHEVSVILPAEEVFTSKSPHTLGKKVNNFITQLVEKGRWYSGVTNIFEQRDGTFVAFLWYNSVVRKDYLDSDGHVVQSVALPEVAQMKGRGEE